jgi:hypothetical protein
MEELERKNKGGDQPMTSRSRSLLPNPSKICKNHWREERGSKLKRVNNGGVFHAQEP